MFRKILAAIALLVVVLLVVIATRPGTFRYTRSLTIAAPPATLFDQVNDLHKFQEWNPWSKIDPAAVMTYSGPPSGVGSAYSWAGNKEVGEGTMTIVETSPGQLVRCRMDFRKPFAGTSTAEFTFQAEGDKTLVSWSMYGPNNFMGKAMGLFIDCDKMIGDQFTKGLENLKASVER